MLPQARSQRTIPQEVKAKARPYARAYYAHLEAAEDFEATGNVAQAQGARDAAASARAAAWALVGPFLSK